MDRNKRAQMVVRKLKKLFPDVHTTLVYSNNWELLVSVMLSAQCTDKKVNEVTETLFVKYPSLNDYIKVARGEFEQDIRQTGFYRNKAANILKTAVILKEKFKGEVPRTMEELLLLPGVARKTANVVLASAYGIVEGIAVDTHVKRFVRKLGLVDSQSPEKIEQELMELLPQKEWSDFTLRIIEYGRQICFARKHECREHPLTRIYPQGADIWPSSS